MALNIARKQLNDFKNQLVQRILKLILMMNVLVLLLKKVYQKNLELEKL